MATEAEPTTLSSPARSPLGIAILAIALYIVLIDAAVETFLSGSPVRWWVAGVVAAYFALSFGLWRYRRSAWEHMGWATRATDSFFLLLALLAFTAWLPDGLTDGIRLLGQPTSRVLSLLTAVVIALAGASLARRSWPKPWVKWVIGALTAYSLVALGKGMISGTSYPELFHGESFWSWLPRWLQGAFVGALIIVPVEVIARAGRMLKAAPGAARTWELRQLVAMAMSVLLVISGVTNSAYGGPQPSAAEIVQPVAKSYQELSEALAGPKPKAPLTADQVADRLEKLFPMLEKAEREIPRDTFDLQAVIDKIGKDPQKLFVWVRDNTYFVPYRGLLRGDKGVLMDRLGNSLDRAMLLYAMLRSIGQPVRLAHGALTEAQAQDVLKKARPFPSSEERTGAASTAAATDAFVKQYADQLDTAKLRKSLDELTAQQLRVNEMVQRRVAAQAAMIAAAVGYPPKSALAAEGADRVRAVTDHWWVQWQNGSDWTDFDSTLPDAKPLQTLVNVKETLAPDNLPSTLYHQVQIRTIVEQWAQGNLKESPVLEQTVRPSELLGQQIALHHAPLKWPADLNLFHEKDPLERLKMTVLAQDEWLPVLSIGENQVMQSSFTDSGEVIHTPLAPILGGGAQKLGGGIGEILGGGGIGQIPARKPEEKTYLTAEWIEYEIRSPGQPVQKIRREIFDLVGPHARTAGRLTSLEITEAQRMERGMVLLGQTEILPMFSQLSLEFFAHLLAKNLLDNREGLLSVLHNADSADPEALAGRANEVKAIPLHLYSLMFALRGVKPVRGDVYLDRLNIFSYHKRFRLAARGEVLQQESFDVVANDIAVRPVSAPKAFFVRLKQGILDTNAEALLAAATCLKDRRSGACREIVNTAEFFAESRGKGMAWLSFRSSHDPSWKEMELPKDIRARVEQDLTAGYEVLVPQKAAPLDGRSGVGWWRIDPKTGTTLGIGEKGWGQTATEYVHMFLGSVAFVGVAVCTAQLYRGTITSKRARAICTIGVVCAAIPLVLLALLFLVPLVGAILVINVIAFIAMDFAIFLPLFLLYMEICGAFETLSAGAHEFLE